MTTWQPELCDEVIIGNERGFVMDWRAGRLADIGVVVNKIMRWYQLSEIAPVKRAETPISPVSSALATMTPDNALRSSTSALEALRATVAYALPTLPPANRTLPAPKVKAQRQPLITPDVIELPARVPYAAPFSFSDVKRELRKRHITAWELDEQYTYLGYGDEVQAIARLRSETDATLVSAIGKDSAIHIVGIRRAFTGESAAA